MLVLRILLALMLVLSAGAAARAASTVDAPCPSKVMIQACLKADLQPILLPGAQDGPSCAAKAIPAAVAELAIRPVRIVLPRRQALLLPEGTSPAARERPPRALQA
ncbi:hypothetical protein [Aureimonas frigidaquae]|uniref:hypothetical protein n=1 Tax=Aureimonas frigidaquae TaxID=424757 RepID=UPI0007842C47|nr:hypothetical protein [Aureimonas frigidaquae]